MPVLREVRYAHMTFPSVITVWGQQVVSFGLFAGIVLWAVLCWKELSQSY
jgi:hypothetical protein